MRKITLIATAAMFVGAQAALAAPLPTASGQQLRGTNDLIVAVKKHKRKKSKMMMQGGQGSMQGGGMQGGGMQGGGMQGGGMQGGGMQGGGQR